MCLQAAAVDGRKLSTFQTFDRVKNYKVVGKVSEFARDFAETSTIYNYIAPITHKGIDKVTPYVPDVSQYVPSKYVEKVDSIGVTCLQRFENVTTTSEEALNGVKTYVKTMLPSKEHEKPTDGEKSYLGSMKSRVYESGKKRVDWVTATIAPATTKVNGIVSAVSTKVSATVAPVTDKVNGVLTSTSTKISSTVLPIKVKVVNAVENARTKVSESVAPVTTRVNTTITTVRALPGNIVSSSKRRVNNAKENVKNFREQLTYENIVGYAVASTSYTLKSSKRITLSFVPGSYRDRVESAVTSCEEAAVRNYKKMPTSEDRARAYSAVKNVDRHQIKELAGVAVTRAVAFVPQPVVSYAKWAASPVVYVIGKVARKSVKEVAEVYDAPEASEPAALKVDDAPEVN